MAAPIIPILKKVASVLLSDKNVWKVIGGVLLGLLFLFMMPILIFVNMFKKDVDVNKDQLTQTIIQRQEEGAGMLVEIEEVMTAAGFGDRAEEAQALYLLALYEKGEEEDFMARLIGCFGIGQTDKQLITAVNAEFGTEIDAAEFSKTMEPLRLNEKEEIT